MNTDQWGVLVVVLVKVMQSSFYYTRATKLNWVLLLGPKTVQPMLYRYIAILKRYITKTPKPD